MVSTLLDARFKVSSIEKSVSICREGVVQYRERLMYTKGDLGIAIKKEYGIWPVEDSRAYAEDSRAYVKVKENQVFLPHSCDEWIIGGPENVEMLIIDLQKYLNGEYDNSHEGRNNGNHNSA